jgi:hypothetical protein
MRWSFPIALTVIAVGMPLPVFADEVVADPPSLTLTGPAARHSLLIHGKRADGSLFDLTRSAKYRVADPKIAAVSDAGVVRALADGQTTIRVEMNGASLSVPVRVVDSAKPRQFHFENDIEPLFGRFGCNASGCHGKAEGQNGFKLSVFGFDPVADYSALLKEARGRRIFPAAPEKSLLLTKPAGQVPHGGGLRIPAGSDAYETLRSWIAAGAPFGDADVPRVQNIRVEPSERILAMHGQQQLRVIAHYQDGREVDVTAHTRFQTNNEAVSSVAADGLVRTADVPGEATIMAAYLNEVAGCRLLVPRSGKVDFPKLAANNFIDPLVDAKLKKLNIVPSGSVDDQTFVRRVYLDVIGTLPTPDEVRAFIKDKAADKRAKLVDALLERPEYAEFWSVYWSDVLRVDRAILGHKRAYSYYSWIRDSIGQNKPYDQFARELVTAEGLLDEAPAANFFRVHTKPGEAASAISQVFLGLRIACAECHHHPFDRWAQDDYYRMSAFFAPLVFSKAANIDTISAIGESKAVNPRSGRALIAAPLGSDYDSVPTGALFVGIKRLAPDSKGDHRKLLADWMVSPKNPYFARNVVNRYWAHFMGRGIIDPPDDVRATNPPTNPELLDALTQNFAESKFDLKKLIRTIVASRVYQISSKPNETNDKDEQNYSRYLFKRLEAEVALDAISQALGVPEKFEGYPAGTRAIQLWDSKVRSYFLKTFGRPARTTPCECERNSEPNIASVLHVLNSDHITAKLQHEGGTVAKLVRKIGDDAKLADEMFMIFFSRPPTEKEKTTVLEHIKKAEAGKRRQAWEDVAWALLNSKEFMFNH